MREIKCTTGSDDLSYIEGDGIPELSEGSYKIFRVGDMFVRITYGDGWETHILTPGNPSVSVGEFYETKDEEDLWDEIRSQLQSGECDILPANESTEGIIGTLVGTPAVDPVLDRLEKAVLKRIDNNPVAGMSSERALALDMILSVIREAQSGN